MKYFTLLLFFLTGCSSFESLTGADQASWESSDFQTKAYSTLTYIEQSGKDLLTSNAKDTDSLLVVRLTEGKAVMWPSGKQYTFKPTIYSLSENSCHNIKLTAKEDVSQTTTLKSCFKNDQLVLDPSRWNFKYKEGSLLIKSSPLWQEDGVVYDQLSSEGYAKLSNLSLDVRYSDVSS